MSDAHSHEEIFPEVRELLENRPNTILVMGETSLGVIESPQFDQSSIFVVESSKFTSRYPEFDFGDLLIADTSSHNREANGFVDIDETGSLPFKSDSVDQIVLTNELGARRCHYHAPTRELLVEAWRVVKPGGYLVSLAHLSSRRSMIEALIGTERQRDAYGKSDVGFAFSYALEESRGSFSAIMEHYGLISTLQNRAVIEPIALYMRKALI